MPDKSRRPRGIYLASSRRSRYLTDLKHDQGGFVKEIPRDEYIYLVESTINLTFAGLYTCI